MPAPLPLHERAHSAKTRTGALQGKRFEENEMSPEGKNFLCRSVSVTLAFGFYDGYRNSSPVCGSGAGPLQNTHGRGVGGAVHDHRFEPLTRELLHGSIGIGTEFDSDLHFAENATKHPNDLVVGA